MSRVSQVPQVQVHQGDSRGKLGLGLKEEKKYSKAIAEVHLLSTECNAMLTRI